MSKSFKYAILQMSFTSCYLHQCIINFKFNVKYFACIMCKMNQMIDFGYTNFNFIGMWDPTCKRLILKFIFKNKICK